MYLCVLTPWENLDHFPIQSQKQTWLLVRQVSIRRDNWQTIGPERIHDTFKSDGPWTEYLSKNTVETVTYKDGQGLNLIDLAVAG